MSPPLMRRVKARLDQMLAASGGDAIIDAPPGVSCPAVNAVMDSDVILLVTEPTPFGFYDFQLAWEAFTPLGKPMGAVINRAGLGNDAIYRFCREKGLPILAEIPYDRAIAEAYARGRVIAEISPGLKETFVSLRDKIRDLAKPSRPGRPPMREIIIISGKGGTGKTSLTGAFAHLAANKVICDLDVDAPDLHLLLQPTRERQEEFYSGHEAEIDGEKCDGCGLCASLCRFGAIRENGARFCG